jgi:hypothetical protein
VPMLKFVPFAASRVALTLPLCCHCSRLHADGSRCAGKGPDCCTGPHLPPCSATSGLPCKHPKGKPDESVTNGELALLYCLLTLSATCTATVSIPRGVLASQVSAPACIVVVVLMLLGYSLSILCLLLFVLLPRATPTTAPLSAAPTTAAPTTAAPVTAAPTTAAPTTAAPTQLKTLQFQRSCQRVPHY